MTRGTFALAVVLATGPLALAGCNTTQCSGTSCQARIDRPGQSVTLGERSERRRTGSGKTRTEKVGGTTFVLQRVEGATAHLSAGGAPTSCRAGETVRVPAATITCTRVGPGVEMKVELAD